MQPILEKIDRSLIQGELTRERFVRPTNNSNNEIYIFDGNTAPHLMNEVGRLREIAFRMGGGGTGKDRDIDEFDLGPTNYKQLIVWNPAELEIIGGYRFALCEDVKDEQGNYHLSTSEIFKYTDKLKREYFPFTIELGRSWVQPAYQPSAENRKGLFSLDNLWDGLGALTVLYPEIRYFFGKVTMYPDFNVDARDHILSFMHAYFPDNEDLVIVENPLQISTDCREFLQSIQGLPYKEGHALLNQYVREKGENIPPLFNSYMNISPSMKTFGTSVNTHFGNVEETGIMINIADIYPSKKERHVESFKQFLSEKGQK